jgi:type III secretion system YopN/LcrE/InvE/MxiC family regulator
MKTSIMLDKINGPTTKAQPTQGSQPHTQSGAAQIFPAESAFDIAQNELSLNPGEFAAAPASLNGVDSESYIETLEDIGFALGARARDGRAMRDGKTDRSRAKAMLGKIGEIAVEQGDQLLARVPAIEQSPAPYDEMRRAGFDAGEMALLLGVCLRRGALTETAGRRFDDALSAVMEGDEWVLLLFNRLEFGAAGRNALAELRQLYRRASTQRPRLAQWFLELRGLPERKRRLKTLIRALAFELSAEGLATGPQLAAVIGDLKRILQFLSMEDHCDRLARSSSIAGLDGDTVMALLIEAIQESWLHANWIADRASLITSDEERKCAFVMRLNEVVKLLPSECFLDEDQKDAVLAAFSACLGMLAE